MQQPANKVAPGLVDNDMNPAHGDFATSLHGLMALKRHGRADLDGRALHPVNAVFKQTRIGTTLLFA